MLGRRAPAGSPTRFDWLLVAAVVAAAEVIAYISGPSGAIDHPALILPLLVPFTALQLRMTHRALVWNRRYEAGSAAVLRFDDFARRRAADAGLSRAA